MSELCVDNENNLYEQNIKILKDIKSTWEMRFDAIQILGEKGGVELIPILNKSLADKHQWVQDAAAWAIWKINSKL